MSLNVDYLLRTADKLEQILAAIEQTDKEIHGKPNECDDFLSELHRDEAIRVFELSLDTVGKLLRKALKAFTCNPRQVDSLVFNDVLRHAGKHGLLDIAGVERWIGCRGHLNDSADCDGEDVARQILDILALLPQYVTDARVLAPKIQAVFDAAA
ncbi:MAG: nucleotidyltransferase substrate binding protein [Burkholderiaceae bacterium]|nr:nucleotidyltransferase substrate binding protein [Burkholderiaceae bacterium]MCD8515781.1 nucleotidyltransferase substrate binding protein [Burkholderiaceae bacterium]MCD8537033.1 nucleotidyltransferase substrate binding protein [Burkholderiaceae bacterium]MCD8565473.1 nucleotidyltransferase substrate binding protein [Burkholderiaceae bacterium]